MIDANQQRFWMLSRENDFNLENRRDVLEWDDAMHVLRFRSSRSVQNLPADRDEAKRLANQTPVTFDVFQTWAKVDETGRTVIAGGVLPDPIEIFSLPAGERVADMAMNMDGILYLVGIDAQDKSTLYCINRRGSKEEGKEGTIGYDGHSYDTEVIKSLRPEAGGQPDRVVALVQGGALLLDRRNKRFWQVVGEPVRDQPKAVYPPRTPRPCSDGPQPQKLIERPDLQLPQDYEVIDVASNPKGEVAVLLYPPEPDSPAAVVVISDRVISAPISLDGAAAPFSIGWVGDAAWALLFDGKNEAFVYPIIDSRTPGGAVSASGRRYPLNWGDPNTYKNKKFCNGLAQPAHYPSTDRKGDFLLRPLHSLSFPAYVARAEAEAAQVIDSGEPNTIWHRLYLEAHLPHGTGVIARLAAAETERELHENPEWALHYFGSVPAGAPGPVGVWIEDASEVPFYPGLLQCNPAAGRAGVFTALVQRTGYTVRNLKGRYLRVKIELTGEGHASPEVAALRIYYPRFSYLDQYLPELYRETNVREKAEIKGPASGPDFLQRFLCLFESVLTPLEDKIASVYMLTNPLSAPSQALDWLGRWIGVGEENTLPEPQKRRYIRKATVLYRRRGTLKGLALALDIATDDMVRQGRIVLLEDFRLRRTFATILGADLSVEDDPLLMGDIPNANSFVGDTLFLGEEAKKEFLALYARDIPESPAEQAVIDNFYARLANRLTVLVHRDTGAQKMGMIRKIVSREIPSHIEFRVVPASKPLLIGLYSLVGVDTYLRDEPKRRVARLGHSFLGRYDFIQKLPVLDDRLKP